MDCVVIGAGVVGLACARALAQSGREVIILEAEDAFGTHTSSRNSEVIHAGLYYAKNSYKARLCVAGKEMLYRYCEEHGIGHQRIGKVLVAAAPEEVDTLKDYVQKAEGNGVTDLRWLSSAELREMEPAVDCVAGFFSPSTGIIDSHGLMLALLGDAESSGAALALKSPLLAGRVLEDGIELRVGGADPMVLVARQVINSAGLTAPTVAGSIEGIPARHIPPQYFAKAHYYSLSGRSPFRHLVYPVASSAHLGVHVTLDLAGQARFGPDISWVDGIDYRFDESREPLFYEAIRKYYPALKPGALSPGYTGIRPKVSPEGQPAADFMIQGPGDHGVPGLVNLFGIESPGLTASLAIADHVRQLLPD
jgi:L-2-hydroxyglutarate oxidase LhgO